MLRFFALAVCLAGSAFAAEAQTEPPLPAALKDWRAWALNDLEYRACPFLANATPNAAQDFVCAWPGRLTLSSTTDGATFAIHWRVEASSWVALPGDTQHWPQQVTVNGQRQPVLPRDDGPSLLLAPGSYEINGRIAWRERPQSIAVPHRIGLITLTVDGKAVAPVQREGTEVTLGRAANAAPEADSIDLRVYRMLADGVPARLTTQIVLAVSGQAREQVIGPVLPSGFAPIALNGEWPARLDGDGRLRVQVQPGSATLTIDARATTPLVAITAQVPAPPWPKQEIWSYAAAPRLRVTVASSAVQVDPRQAEVPGDWQQLPAFALGDGAKLAIEERSRGLAADEANRLTLQREAWFDFSGDGWYARDHVSGTMAQGWRLDLAAPFALEQARSQNNGGEALLITRGAKPDETGVEWRLPHVDLSAGVRIAAPAAMPVTGWQQSFDSVQATLHFPFGYKLLGAPGADGASGSWAAGWTLLDVFVCAIAVLLAWRLLGIVGALVAVAFLLLGYQESGVPLWTLIAALGLGLIARALPPGKLGRVAQLLRRAALLLLALVALPFAANQVRYALYPQLEGGGYAGYGIPGQDAYQAQAVGGMAGRVRVAEELKDESGDLRTMEANAPQPAAPPTVAEVPVEADMLSPPPSPPPRYKSAGKPASKALDKTSALETIAVTGSRIDRSQLIEHYSDTTVVQTGHGAPSWNLASTAWLSWSGPVLATQQVRLLIAPPWLVRPLRIVLAALLAWLIWRLVRSGGNRPSTRAAAIGAAGLVTGALLIGALALPPSAHAQGYPPAELLQQMRERLQQAPKCAPSCASLAEAQVTASGESIGVALEVHAGERVAIPLPDDATAILKSVQVDGAAADGVARDANGRLWLAVGRGVHRVQLDFTAPADKFALAFPLEPGRVLFQGKGWEASGLSDDRLMTETLTLVRAHDNASSTQGAAVQQFPPYVSVTRHLSLGLEWSASTSVSRVSPAEGGFTVEIPLLPGEHIGTTGIKVLNGKAQIAIPDEGAATTWQSTVDKADTLTLTAPLLADHAEVWSVIVSPTWHADFSGVPETGVDVGEDVNDFRNFEFHPLPGESLTLRITRPAVAQGASRAIDAVNLASDAGQRSATHVLTFNLRASQGGEQAIILAKDAQVLAVKRDGLVLNVRPLDGRLSLPVVPGTQRYEVRFRSTEPIGTIARTPDVALGLPAANIALTLQLPGDRWLLAAFGPAVGPAVLYWGELIVMVAIAWALARTRRTRLGFRDWLLLGLGFSTFSWIALIVVVAWLFAFDWRARAAPPAPRWQFNLLQAALVALTAVAVLCLVSAIPQGLLGQPDMHVTGNGSYATTLRWFADRSTDALPAASAVSVPLWVYKVLMLAWAIWLANALIGWLRQAFAAWTRDGYWRPRPTAATLAAATPLPGDAEAT